MPSLGVNIAILESGKVLLTKREDFEVWCLPGGAVDDGESLADAALREAREETGLAVELKRLVGIYSRPNWHDEGSHIAVFAAAVVGGTLRLQPSEVLEARYFDSDELSDQVILFGQKQRILDALNDVTGAVWTQYTAWPFPIEMTRKELYQMRDQSGLSRLDFYLKHFGRSDVEKQKRIV